VKQKTAAELAKEEQEDDDEDEAQLKYSEMETFRFSPFFYLSLFLSIFLSVFVHLLSFDCLVFSLLLMLMRARRSINIQRWKHSGRLFIRVTDPHSFDPDPIRIQGFDGQRLEKIYN
jgi:hypothetical protein